MLQILIHRGTKILFWLGLISSTVAQASTSFDWTCHSKSQELSSPGQWPSDFELQSSNEPIHFGYLPYQTCWVRLQIENPSSSSRTYFIEHRYPLTGDLVLFDQNGVLDRNGFLFPFESRTVPFAHPSFQLSLEPGQHEFVIRIQSRDIMRLDFKVWEESAFLQHIQAFYAIHGGFVILCLSLALYNLMQFWVTRRMSFFYYVVFLFNYSFAHLFMSGIFPQLFLSGDSYWSQHLVFYFVQVCHLSASGFAFTFLKLKKNLPKAYRLLFVSFIPLTIAVIYNLAGIYPETGRWNIISLALGSTILLLLGSILVFRGHRSGYFFMAAWGILLLGLLVFLGALLGLLPNNTWTQHAHIAGAAIEMIVLSFALADQVKQKQLQVIREREHAFSQLKKMVYPHQLEQIKRGINLEDTMPCKGEEATVICFDVVNSSKLSHPLAKEFLSRVFHRCHQQMEINYSFRPLSAQGFRLKEMGDGFLCSIGFPFHCPENREQAVLAFKLAKDFISIFDEEAREFPFGKTLQASVGIARGYVEGFFTVSGTRNYELFGPGIILATRYESVRKNAEILENGHLIVVQDHVYQRLTEIQKREFQAFPLGPETFSIRDDTRAKVFYYCQIKARNCKQLVA